MEEEIPSQEIKCGYLISKLKYISLFSFSLSLRIDDAVVEQLIHTYFQTANRGLILSQPLLMIHSRYIAVNTGA